MREVESAEFLSRGEGRDERGFPAYTKRSSLGLISLLLTGLLIAFLSGGCTSHQSTAPALQSEQKPLPFEKEILAFEASDRTNPPPRGAILFIGSSSIRLWKTLAQDFPGHRVVNRGFGGSQIIDSVGYADRIVFPYQPKQIVLYAGGNDINAKKTPEQVFADYRAFVKKVHAKLPRTRIAYISIAPNPARWAQVEQVREANRLIAEHTKTDRRLTFIDTFTHMLGADGQPLPDIYVADRLHMNAKGYELWKGIVGPALGP
jgi:lysophospholipase L1-like esterase